MFVKNVSLSRRNTFGIAANAHYVWDVHSEKELVAALNTVTAKNLPLLVLGGGSNVVFSQDYAGMVLCPKLMGIRSVARVGSAVIVEAAAGENWHLFVQHCLAQGWYGLENLSLIPGTVGAAPIQNIGAYGVEIKDCFHSLRAIDRHTGVAREFPLAECQFGYRESVFKQALKDCYIITHVRFQLSTQATVKMHYGDIATALAQRGITQPSPQDVAQAVISIRQQKLPDPAIIGNAGSFFKNPVISLSQFEQLKAQFPQLIAYPQTGAMKLAAGWLIEQTGWKGQSLGRAGVYEKQALVLVNRGGVAGEEVLKLAQTIQQDVLKMFQVQLEIEANII